ncbi:GMC oxidoreductase [Xylariaceae sp. FL1651]|nr:GMC oxidoreductase [Xylariaceae sp. FL1651]
MGLSNCLSDDLGEVDVIIAGGGTAGCIVAGRLAEADPNLSILVIEGGLDNYENLTVVTPAMFLTHLAPDSKTALFYQTVKSKYLADREAVVPSGGILGGGSSINFMMYTRAQREDYDSWKIPGWTADELYPYLKKLETYHGPRDERHHGFAGPVHVSDGTMRLQKVEDDVLRAAAQVGGWPEVSDLQTLDGNNGFQRWQRYVSPAGQRSDTAHAYLHPRLRDGAHPNLHVLVESQVVRVLFDDKQGKRACGVEYRPNPRFQSGGVGKRTVRARRLVVLSCGACGTPSVLERSGVGPKDVLERAGVPLVEDLPGVGHDYQDHHLILWPYKSFLEPHETLDDLLSGRYSFADAMKANDPRLGWNTIDIAAKVRPTEEEVAALGPEFKAAWDRDYKDKPNRPLMLMALLNAYFGPPGSIEPGQYVSIGAFSAYPYSRGHIHITGPEVDDPLDFDAGFFSDAGDVDIKKHIWGYKKGREIARRTALYRGEVAALHPPFPASSKAACITVESPRTNGADGSQQDAVQDLEYTPEDDKLIEQFLRENINTTWHSLGTAKMAPREKSGVVDRDLNVYGVAGLKIADISIAPENVAANTNNTALVIGEKAADIIIRELGLRK